MDKSSFKKIKLTEDKCVGKQNNFEVISPKKESETLKMLVEEYSKDFENSERHSEGLGSTNEITDTFKGIPVSTK